MQRSHPTVTRPHRAWPVRLGAALLTCLIALPAGAGVPVTQGTATAATAATTARDAATRTDAPAAGGSWNRGGRAAEGTAHVDDPTLDTGAGGLAGLLRAPLSITVNDGLSGLEEEVIPALVGSDRLELDDVMLLDDWVVPPGCATADAYLDEPTLVAPIDASSFDARFGNDGKILTDIDLDASFSTTFIYRASEAGGALCDAADAIEDVIDFLTPGSEIPETAYQEQHFEADDVTGEIDLTLALDGDELALASVDKLEASIGAIRTYGTDTTNLLAQIGMGLATATCSLGQALSPLLLDDAIADLLGLEGDTITIGGVEIDLTALADADPVYDITDCANLVVEAVLIPTESSLIANAIDTALRQNLAFEQSLGAGLDVTASVQPAALHSSRADDTMTVEFDFAAEGNGPEDPCAANLRWSAGLAASDPPSTSRDFDLEVPHRVLAETLYEVGRQGLFCSGATPAQPWIVEPNGTLTVESGEVRVCGERTCWIEHWGELLVSLPLSFQGDGVGASGDATGTLLVYLELFLEDRVLKADVTEVDVVDVVGTLTLPSGFPLDVSALVSTSLNTLADTIQRRLPVQPLLPAVTQLSDEFALELATIAMNDTYTSLGIDIIEAPEVLEAPQWEMEVLDRGPTEPDRPLPDDPIDALGPLDQELPLP